MIMPGSANSQSWMEEEKSREQGVGEMASGEPNWPVPMKAIGAQNLLTMPGGVTISGYLHKRGGKQLQIFKWPLRYVIIHKGCVYYFKSSTSASSQGAFSLNGYNRVMRAAEETTSNNVFPFKMVHISKKHRTWYFSAASEEERKKWMLALRKEIDRYHEKKEAITDLSESGSDSDSFYGTVERPVAIKYIHNPADDTWQDEDDDEEDYVKPDCVNDGAPSYPPPPVPRPKPEELQPRHSVSSITMSKPLPALPKKVIPEVNLAHPRKDSALQNKNELDGIPPQIPHFPPAHKPPPPLPPVHNATDKPEKLSPRPRKVPSGLFLSSDKSPPTFQPPTPWRDSSSISSSKNELPKCLTTEEKHSISQNSMVGNNLLKQELCNVLKNVSPPPIPSKPALLAIEELPNKPSHIPPPPPPTKPSYLSRRTEDNNPTHIKNSPKIMVNDNKLLSSSIMKSGQPKPPAVLPRICPQKADSQKTEFSKILRSPPDGQSFVDKSVETPIRPARLKDLEEESDDDYEKVPLPASVFVDTCESSDVERMFKAMDIKESPLNGLFCIRNSAKAGKVIVVWDKQDAKLRNYRIYEKDAKVYLEGEILFTDIASLVEHYYKSPLPGHNTLVLKHAYGCMGNPR
ncbi:SH3 domain-binding protein 2 isoform X2 [Pyxicephalus adspersus]|uniref:SH3 domain-binding protein 2 isoform X2 n=1 Tax=Pyxicephalus adspersus TaxID=30357 RepID=UPI003B5CDE63